MKRILVLIIIILALIGLIDATYLTIEHYANSDLLFCATDGGCDIVTNSAYSKILGVPVSFFGIIYYAFIAIVAAIYLKRKTRDSRLLGYTSAIGFLASIYFVSIQLFVLHAICWYCMGSAVTSTLIFLLGTALLIQQNKNTSANPET